MQNSTTDSHNENLRKGNWLTRIPDTHFDIIRITFWGVEGTLFTKLSEYSPETAKAKSGGI